LLDRAGNVVLRLSLPARLVEYVVMGALSPGLAMSPDSMLTVQFDSEVVPKISVHGISIVALVTQSMMPDMLEDESDLDQKLATLLERLKEARQAVEAARAGLR
jgi:hypothetical protein